MEKTEAMRLAGGLAFKEEPALGERVRAAHRRRFFRELADSWDLWYDLFFHNDPPGMTRSEYETLTGEEARRLLPWIPSGGSFLDLGCGGGRILRSVAFRCGAAHGADISPKALAHARSSLRGIGNIRLHRLRALDLPFGDSELDVVFCHLMLSHMDVEPVILCLREVCRVLRPGGRFIFDLPNLLSESHLAYLLDAQRTNWPGMNRPRFWTAEMARTLVSRCGFDVEDMVPGIFIEVRASKRGRAAD